MQFCSSKSHRTLKRILKLLKKEQNYSVIREKFLKFGKVVKEIIP